MPIAVISDLHIGRGGPRDPFGHRDNEFLRFLDYLEANFRRIVLLGDVWETLHGGAPFTATRRLRLARQAHPQLAERFASPRYTYLHGNHDRIAERVDGAPAELVVHEGGTRLLFMHGHLYDWIIRRALWVSEFGSWVGGGIVRLGLTRVMAAIDRLQAGLRRPSADPERCPFQTWAYAVARERQADVVVTAHTHLLGHSQQGGQVYLNSGTCRGGQFSFAALDPRSGRYSIHTSW